MTTATPSMQALLVDDVDAPFRRVHLPRPALATGQVLVRIAASGINPLDTKIRAGKAEHARQPLPAVLGMDLAGVVEALGEGVTRFKVGDEVYGMATGIGGTQGSLAQYAAVDARLLALKPRTLTLRQAAALPLVTITAWEGLVDRARVSAGQSVLVHGGAGGIGHVAVQLARARGARVYATGTAEQASLIRAYGATAIDYRRETVADYVGAHTDGAGFDIVFDTIGGATLDASFQAARVYGGHVLSALGWGTHALAPLSFRAASYSGVFTLLPLLTGQGRGRHGEILAEAAALVEAGHLCPRLDPRRFGMADIEQAHALVAQGRAEGKVVVEIE